MRKCTSIIHVNIKKRHILVVLVVDGPVVVVAPILADVSTTTRGSVRKYVRNISAI